MPSQQGGPIRAVVFDAVGTLIFPEPAPSVVYAEVCRRFGGTFEEQTIRQRFRAAFARQELQDRTAGWHTSEAREKQRWRTIVADVLQGVSDTDACFAALYDHFSRPAHWRCHEAAADLIATVEKRGCAVALASNFDSRLRGVAAGLPALADLGKIVISSEIGWRKPAVEFFSAVAAVVNTPLSTLLVVGDDQVNDYDGALAAGCQALLFVPRGTGPAGCRSIDKLERLVDFLG